MRSIFIITVISFLLTACAAQPAAPTLVPTATFPPTSTSLPTETATPTEAPLSATIQEKFDLAGIDTKKMGNAEFKPDGLHVTLDDGNIVIYKSEELEKKLANGQKNVLQIWDGKDSLAFDPETKKFLEAKKYIQYDVLHIDNYIRVKTMDEVKEIWRVEKLFLSPFDPERTYFPESEDIFRDYLNSGNRQEGFYYPLGKVPEGKVSPVRLFNGVMLEANEAKGRETDTGIISQQIYNPDDGTFSVLHFAQGEDGYLQASITEQLAGENRYLLPKFDISEELSLSPQGFNVLEQFYNQNNVEDLTYTWFDDRHVPQELESILLSFRGASIR